jgi:hypothetical protein
LWPVNSGVMGSMCVFTGREQCEENTEARVVDGLCGRKAKKNRLDQPGGREQALEKPCYFHDPSLDPGWHWAHVTGAVVSGFSFLSFW